jgi:putative ABC transport system permease protein
MTNVFSVALRAIMLNKVRAFLTILGVVIGVFAVVMLTGIGYGLQGYITDQFESFGTNNIYVQPGQVFSQARGGNSVAQNKLRDRHLKKIEQLREYVQYVVPLNSASSKVTYRDTTKRVSIMITNEHFFEAINMNVVRGRAFSKSEVESGDKVVVLGPKLATDLFGAADPLGKKIRLEDQNFTVIGVTEEKGAGIGGNSYDEIVVLPYETGNRIFDINSVSQALVKVRDKDRIDETIAQVKEVLSKDLDEEDFSVIDQSQVLDMFNSILGVLTAALAGISGISLLVGGIGIMNIMLVSVTERTKEIGLRKALGATPNMILRQFLIEAALLSILGGLIGLGLAALGISALNTLIPARLTFQSVALALGVSIGIGLIFGVAPAKRAAQLSPIEALRYE